MTYASLKTQPGREPIQVVEMDLDFCNNTYGVAPCTASGSAGSECYNTRKTCQDAVNYNRGTKTYRLIQQSSSLKSSDLSALGAIPCAMREIDRAPATITAGKGLGARHVVKMDFADFPHHDRGIDPYADTRPYTPEEQGTFWGKLIARNPYYEGRTIRIRTGYIDSPWSWSNFQDETYIISDIDGPATNGHVMITAKDVLTLTYGRKNVYPVASEGVLAASITDVATSATLSPAGIGDTDYPASGYISINDEAIAFTRSGDTLTLTRAQFGTTAAAHNADDTVQVCAAWSGTNVVDVLYELLVTGAGISSALIPYDNGATGTPDIWDDEKSVWLSTSVVTGIIMKPEPVDKLINEMCESFMFDIWFDPVNNEIPIKAVAPPTTALATFNDNSNIIKDSLTVKRDQKQRYTEVHLYYDKRNYSEDDSPEHFSKLYITANISNEGADKYGDKSIKVLKSRWINDAAQAATVTGRLVNRHADTPKLVEFIIDKKDEDSVPLAGIFNLNTRQIQGDTGAATTSRFQVTSAKETRTGSHVRITGLTSAFAGRYFFIAPDGTPDYSSATDEQKEKYGFISPDSGTFSDGEPAYKII